MTRKTDQNAMIAAVKHRRTSVKSSGRYGYGISTADCFVRQAIDDAGSDACGRYFGGLHLRSALSHARKQLTFCCPAEVEKSAVRADFASLVPSGIEVPKNTLMVVRHTVTTDREDRDGDRLHTGGADLDPRAPLLWQHIPNLPLGKVLGIIEHNDQRLRVASCLLDMNDLTADAAVLIEADVLRFSHGFRPLEYAERVPAKGQVVDGPVGFDVFRFEIMEVSLVSVPSNVDAEIELFGRNKLKSPLFKAHAQRAFDKRSKIHKGVDWNNRLEALTERRGESDVSTTSTESSSVTTTTTNGEAGTPVEQRSVMEAPNLRGGEQSRLCANCMYFNPVESVECGVCTAYDFPTEGEWLCDSYELTDDADRQGITLDSLQLLDQEEDSQEAPMPMASTDVPQVASFVGCKRYGTPPSKDPHDLGRTDERWNRKWGKSFDVPRVQLEASKLEYEWVSRFIGVEIKNLVYVEVSSYGAWLPSFLFGLDESVKQVEQSQRIDRRNITDEGKEKPPEFERLDMTIDKADVFMVNGLDFYKYKDGEFVVKRRQSYRGIEIRVYVANTKTEFAMGIINNAWKIAHEQNFLKGQCFALSGEFLPETGEKWDDVILDPKHEQALRRTVKLINTHGEKLPNRGMILCGPPGTGKTLSGRIMRNEAEATFIWVSTRDFWHMGTAGAMMMAFELAKELGPTILFFEDMDAWISDSAIDFMKTEMDGIGRSAGVVTVLATNFPRRLPEALLDRPGRFHDVIEMKLPTAELRQKMLEKWLPDLTPDELQKVVAKTGGYSGAHLYELTYFAKTIKLEDETLDLMKAVELAIDKITEQREFINGTQQQPGTYRRDAAPGGVKGLITRDEVLRYAKSGRVLSEKNMRALTDVMNDIEEASKIEGMPRAASALCERCVRRLGDVIAAATPATGQDATPDDERVIGPSSAGDASLQASDPPKFTEVDALAVILSSSKSIRDKVRRALDATDTVEQLDKGANEYRALIHPR